MFCVYFLCRHLEPWLRRTSAPTGTAATHSATSCLGKPQTAHLAMCSPRWRLFWPLAPDTSAPSGTWTVAMAPLTSLPMVSAQIVCLQIQDVYPWKVNTFVLMSAEIINFNETFAIFLTIKQAVRWLSGLGLWWHVILLSLRDRLCNLGYRVQAPKIVHYFIILCCF